MPHEVTVGKDPDIVILRYFGDIETEDIITDPEELHLNDGRMKYLLADASNVNPVVPEGMWERVHASIISNKNIVHIAIAVKSGMLRVLMTAVIKLTRQGSRVSLHSTSEEAENHLLSLIKTTQYS
jgi:hypothetical protein